MKGIILFRCGLIITTIFVVTPIVAQNIMPFPYSSNIPQNYIRIWDATAPITNPDTLKVRGLRDVKQTTQYFDGLGRLLQTVIKKGSLVTGNSPVDLVSRRAIEHSRNRYRRHSILSTAVPIYAEG